MPTFRYEARDGQGASHSGATVAPSMEILAAELRERGLLVLELNPVSEATSKRGVTLNPLTWLPATSFDVEVGLQQMAAMMHSGLSLLASLRVVGEQARRPRATQIWTGVAERIEEGATFSSALAAQPKIFSEHVRQLVSVGEHSGTLDSALTRSAEHLERIRNMRLLLLNALTYPAIVLVMAIGVTGFMMVSVIPRVQQFLGTSGRRLPGITQTLLDVSSIVTKHAAHFGIAIVALPLAAFFIYRWPPGRRVIDSVLLRVPVIGGILRLSGTAVFARGLHILLESGVNLLDSLSTIERLVGNHALSARVAAARMAVLRGETLASTLTDGRYFLPMLGRMIAVGETAGTLAPVLSEVARFHEGQLVITIRRMSVLVEPVLIIVVGGIVGFVYIAFFLALFSIAGGVR